jgi:hypothetical protein
VTTVALSAGAVLVAAVLPVRGPALAPVGDYE